MSCHSGADLSNNISSIFVLKQSWTFYPLQYTNCLFNFNSKHIASVYTNVCSLGTLVVKVGDFE